MNGLIEKLKIRSDHIKEQRNTFISKFVELNDILAETLSGIDVWAKSGKEFLEMIGPDDWIYGYLSFSEGELQVIYRSTEDDFHDAINQVSEEYQSYQFKSIH